MSTLTKTAPTQSPVQGKGNKLAGWLTRHHILCALFFSCVLEACVFGLHARQVGIYLDEWTTFYELHFCRQSWFGFLQCFFLDPRIIIRPAFVPCLATIYYFCHDKPLFYHLFIQACEIGTAMFLYLSLVQILKDKATSFISSALFVIYPSHDMTHYTIGAMSTTTAVTLFTASLWIFARAMELKKLAMNGLEENRNKTDNGLILLSGFLFLLSLLNYEICLPLFVVFTAVAATLLWKKQKPAKVLLLSALYTVPSLVAIALTVWFRKLLMPSLKLGQGYRMSFDALHFVNVIYSGIKVSILPYAFSFFASLAKEFLNSGVDATHLICLAIAIVSTPLAAWIFTKAGDQSPGRRASIAAIALGALILVCAYVIFGLTPDYMPMLDKDVNRVNTASSIGAAMIIAGLITYLGRFAGTTHKQSAILTGLLLPVVFLFTLADWQFAVPWIESWKAQQQVMTLIKRRAGEIRSGDTIILAGLPRYDMWAPVFDGIWDFQSALRISLNRRDVNGGVLSDRMVITPAGLEDRFQNLLCARYSFKQLIMLVPSRQTWVHIQSPQQFLGLAKQYGVPVRVEGATKHIQ